MNNYYPYNPYGYNPQQYQEQFKRAQIIKREKHEMRKRSSFVALGIIFYILISFICWRVLFVFDDLKTLYNENTAFSLSIDVLIAAISLFGAYFISRLMIDRKHEGFIPVASAANKKHAFLLIPVGILACIAGAFITMIGNSFLEEAFNVTFSQPEIPNPKTPVELWLYIMSGVVVPCIFEEIALRAGALQAMRKYGDWFAIITSSFVFAILHGNMIQTPFAFIAGIALGYIYVVTGTIWPGVIIHLINNFTTCLSLFSDVFSIDSKILDIIYIIYVIFFVVLGTVCLIVYLFDKNRPALRKSACPLTLWQKTVCFVINVPMIFSILYMGLVTLTFISQAEK